MLNGIGTQPLTLQGSPCPLGITWGSVLALESVAKDFVQVWKDVRVEARFPAAPQGAERVEMEQEEATGRALSCWNGFQSIYRAEVPQGGNMLMLQLRKLEVGCMSGSQPCLQK